MALTAADLDALDAAALQIATDGIASVTIAGQTTQLKSLKELRDFRNEAAQQVASGNSFVGMRTRKTIPPGAG